MKCPNCNETLLMTHRNNIEIDYCPNCRGVWLDKGELDKLLDVASQRAPEAYPPQQEYQGGFPNKGHNYGYGHKKPYKKKSFLNDFFDFD